MKNNAHSGMWAYLNASGVLEHGSAMDIANVKKEWRKKKDRERKQRVRAEKQEHIVSLSILEDERLNKEAKNHGLSASEMMRRATFAYFDSAYVPPDLTKIFQVQALMRRTVTQIEIIAKRDRSWLSGQRDYTQVKEEVQQLCERVEQEYVKPKTLDEAIIQMAKDSPIFRERILNILK